MPTAVTVQTRTLNSSLSLKSAARKDVSPPNMPPDSAAANGHGELPVESPLPSLNKLYNRAARAFLHRDIPSTYSSIESAFHSLKPPSGSSFDTLSSQRKKWDVLRLTLVTTVYSAPPSDAAMIPANLREDLLQSPQTLITIFYNRSLRLHTPSSRTLNAAYLPQSVLSTLLLAGLKLGAPGVSRDIVEDWLAKRDPSSSNGDDDGMKMYQKVLDMYCLHILPRLEEWDYAKEFLEYESELPPDKRQVSQYNARWVKVKVN